MHISLHVSVCYCCLILTEAGMFVEWFLNYACKQRDMAETVGTFLQLSVANTLKQHIGLQGFELSEINVQFHE